MIHLGFVPQNLPIPATNNRTLRLASLHNAEKVRSLIREKSQPEEGMHEARDLGDRPKAAPMSPVAIVTASDSGIGQEAAKELAENGFDVPFPSYKQT